MKTQQGVRTDRRDPIMWRLFCICFYLLLASVSQTALLSIFYISNKRPKGTRKERAGSRNVLLGKPYAGHSWNTGWWIVSSHRHGTVEISNRKESGGRSCLYGGCSPFYFFIPRGDGACYVVDDMSDCANSTASWLRRVFYRSSAELSI